MTLVITAETPEGKSIIAKDVEPAPLVASAFPFLINLPFDASDEPIALPTDGSRKPHGLFFPPVGGYRFFALTIDPIDPNSPPAAPTEAQMVEANDIFPGLFGGYDESGMERTDTIDLGYVISGTVVLHLDDGVEKELHAGDAFVQNGTHHRWSNPGTVPAVFVVIILGAERS